MRTYMRARSSGVVVIVLAGALLIACERPAAPTLTSATIAANDVTTAAARYDQHHHAGITLLIVLSLDTLDVDPDQSVAIDAIRREMHANMSRVASAERALRSLLADGIAVGAIDHRKVDAAVADVVDAAEGSYQSAAVALDTLHAALTPAQRATLVEKVRDHWESWKTANEDEKALANGKARLGGHLARLTRDIALTQAQLDTIHANLASANHSVLDLDAQDIDNHIRAFGHAFVADSFDAAALTTGSDADGRVARFGAERMVRFYEAVIPVLDSNQRSQLATILRVNAFRGKSKT